VDKIVTTTLLIIAGVVCAIFLFNSVFPMVNRSSDAITTMADKMDDRMKSRISIVQAASTVDRKAIYIWVKNVGSSTIQSIDQCDVFCGQEGNYYRIPYAVDAGGAYPQWNYSLENDDNWQSNATLKITVTYTVDPGVGTYYIKIVIPNGIADEYYFSM
jgi:archaellum component FlaF (FlaF/FlaG flagellin family)